MEDPDRNASFSLAKPFPRKYRFFRRKAQDHEHELNRISQRGKTEPDPQVVAAEAQAEENLSSSFVSDGSTQIDERDEQALVPPGPLTKKIKSDAFWSNAFGSDGIAGKEPGNDRPCNFWGRIRQHCQRPLAEWLGTTVFMFIGISGNLAAFTSKFEAGNMQSIYWCWGFAVMLAIYIAGGGSGAFLNPALTIMLSMFRGFPARRVPVYIFAQLLGAFTGAVLAFLLYRDNIMHLDGALIPASTGIAFYTQPKDWVSPITAFFCEVAGTAVISCSVLALGDAGNSPPGAGMHAFIIGLLTVTATMSLGYSTGGCFNPARDLGPRLATLAVGYPPSLFASHHHWWLWGPWFATITGAILGAVVYDLCIFKGSESPINYSSARWRTETRKAQQSAKNTTRVRRVSSTSIESQMEAGKLSRRCSGSIDLHFEPDDLEFDRKNVF